MINGLHTSALAAFGQSTKMGIISNNLANLNTPGFRREMLTFGERMVEAMEPPEDFEHYNAYIDRYGGAPFIDSMHFDKTPGPLNQTGRSLDLAIDGNGYFGVKDLRSGELFFTRAGGFNVDPAGKLVTADGRYQVVDVSGEPISLDLKATSEIRIDRTGQITLLGVAEADGEQIGIFIVPEDQLTKYGNTLLRNLGAAPAPAPLAGVRQGYLEMSSVDPVQEMVNLISTARFIESNLQMIRFQDATLDRAINTLGDTG